MSTKLFTFPEGVMTRGDWIRNYASFVEEINHDKWHFYDRTKFNRSEDQAAYMASLEKKAKKPCYYAFKNDVSLTLTKAEFETAQKLGLERKSTKFDK